MFCHLSALSGFIGVPFGSILGPLIIWLLRREEYAAVDAHGRESMNFQISTLIYAFGFVLVALATRSVALAVLGLLGGLVAYVALIITGAVKAASGEPFAYPGTIRFLR